MAENSPEQDRPDEQKAQDSGGTEDEMIVVFDKYGREVRVTREEWSGKILPEQIEANKDSAEDLYAIIVMGLEDGFVDAVADACDRLMELEDGSERARILKSVVLAKQGDKTGARALLQEYCDRHGATSLLLTNIAKTYDDSAVHKRLLLDALKLDPNQENALEWYGAIHGEESGEDGFFSAMERIAEIDGSWRAQLWMARVLQTRQQLDDAMALYKHALDVSGNHADALAMISGDLGALGLFDEIFDMIAPLYDAEKHGLQVGVNLMEAAIRTGQPEMGETWLKALYALNQPTFKPTLDEYAARLEMAAGKHVEAEQAAEAALQARDEPQEGEDDQPAAPQIQGLQVNMPVWYFGLENPEWLLKDAPEKSDIDIAFIPFADRTMSDDGMTRQKEAMTGRISRGMQLFLAEEIYFHTDARIMNTVPVAVGLGPVISSKDWDIETIRTLVFQGREDPVEYAVTGAIDSAEAGGYDLSVEVWDVQKGEKVWTGDYHFDGTDIARKLVEMRDALVDMLHERGALKKQEPSKPAFGKPIYNRLNAENMVADYPLSLNSSLMLTLVVNGLVPADRLWHEREIYNYLLDMALDHPELQVPKVQYVSAIIKALSFDSGVVDEFFDKTMMLLTDSGRESPVFRLMPLVLKKFGKDKDFKRALKDFGTEQDPDYRAWLKRLGEGVMKAA